VVLMVFMLVGGLTIQQNKTGTKQNETKQRPKHHTTTTISADHLLSSINTTADTILSSTNTKAAHNKHQTPSTKTSQCRSSPQLHQHTQPHTTKQRANHITLVRELINHYLSEKHARSFNSD
jgi:hypothetical protein